MSEELNTPTSKTAKSYNIEALITPSTHPVPNFSLSPYFNGSSPFPSFSPFFQQTGAMQPTYLNQGAGTPIKFRGFNPPFQADCIPMNGNQTETTPTPRALFPHIQAKNNNGNLIFAKKSSPPNSETATAVANIPGYENEEQQSVLTSEQQREQPREEPCEQPCEQPSQQPREQLREQPCEQPGQQPREQPCEQPGLQQGKEKSQKQKKTVKRTNKAKVACPGGCKMSFIVGSNDFNQHLMDYHYLVNNEPRKLMRALHKKVPVPRLVDGGPVTRVLSCSGCYKECATQEEAKACAATHPAGMELKCVLGCLDRKKKVIIFKSKVTLQKHMRDQHGLTTKTKDSKMTYTCVNCAMTFTTKFALKRHNKKYHKDETTATTTSVPVSTTNTASTGSSMSLAPSTSPVPPISLVPSVFSNPSISIVPSTSTLSTMSTMIMEPDPSTEFPGTSNTTITLSLMPAASGVPVLGGSGEVVLEDQIQMSQKSYDSNEGMILSQ